MEKPNADQQTVEQIQQQFHHSDDFVVKQITLANDEQAILCFYASLVKKSEAERYVYLLKSQQNRTMENENSVITTVEPYDENKFTEALCNGETILYLQTSGQMIRINAPDFAHRSPEEPSNESVIQGSHDGFVEQFDTNVSLIRKRIKSERLIVKKLAIGTETKTNVYYIYMDGVVDEGALQTVEDRLNNIQLKKFFSPGQLSDCLDDNVWSPFPQLLNTERPDRVIAGIVEGKIAVMTDLSANALVGPASFFSFYTTPDDFNSRVVVGSFYRFLRITSFFTAIFLPAIYISIVGLSF